MVSVITPLHRGNYSAAWFRECGERYELARKTLSDVRRAKDGRGYWFREKERLAGVLEPLALTLLIDEMNRQRKVK